MSYVDKRRQLDNWLRNNLKDEVENKDPDERIIEAFQKRLDKLTPDGKVIEDENDDGGGSWGPELI